MSKVSGICSGFLLPGSWVCGISDLESGELSPAMQVSSLSDSWVTLHPEGEDSIPPTYPYEMLRPINLTEFILRCSGFVFDDLSLTYRRGCLCVRAWGDSFSVMGYHFHYVHELQLLMAAAGISPLEVKLDYCHVCSE